MNFCEQCGQRLNPDARFCEQCGAASAIGRGATSEDANGRAGLFDESCLVVINRAGWRARWGHSDATALELDLRKYIASRSRQSGIAYNVCDVSSLGVGESPSWHEPVGALKSLLRRSPPKYILLIGGSTDLPMASFSNPVRENPVLHDANVHSDYCYGLLSEADLGRSDSEMPCLPTSFVGRLPLGSDTSVADVMRYFRNACTQTDWPGHGTKCVRGVSAEVWEVPSEEILRRLDSGASVLHKSPTFSVDTFDHLINQDPACLFFNVHGGKHPNQVGWLGHKKNVNDPGPEVARPDCFDLRSANIIVSEACYGARFFDPQREDEFSSEQSILLKVIFNKTLAFVGASKITFAERVLDGQNPEGKMCFGASDKMASEFLGPFATNTAWSQVGKSAGELMASARVAMCEHEYDTTANPGYDTQVKKMFLSFNLFGDPTLFLNRATSSTRSVNNPQHDSRGGGNAGTGLHQSLRQDLQNTMSGLHGVLRRDLFRKITQLHTSLTDELKNRVTNLVYTAYPHLIGVQPMETCLQGDWGTVGHLLHYAKEMNGLDAGAIVVCDEFGNIEKVLTSK